MLFFGLLHDCPALQRQHSRASRLPSPHSRLSCPSVRQCKAQPTNPSSTESQGAPESPAATAMDSHLLLDVLTLSAVGLLLILLITAKVTKKRKGLMATKTSASQTSSWDLDKALAKINEDLPRQTRKSGATLLRVHQLPPLVREHSSPPPDEE